MAEYFSQTSSFRSRSARTGGAAATFFDSIVQQESLQQHLIQQLSFINVTEDKRKVAELIIGSINDDGDLLTPIEERQSVQGSRWKICRKRSIWCRHFVRSESARGT